MSRMCPTSASFSSASLLFTVTSVFAVEMAQLRSRGMRRSYPKSASCRALASPAFMADSTRSIKACVLHG